LAIVVSSTSMKVATDTTIAISQGFVPMGAASPAPDGDLAFVMTLTIKALASSDSRTSPSKARPAIFQLSR
jgi:hypothetical protein